MKTLLVGFDSAWTPGNVGAIAGALVGEAEVRELGLPVAVDFEGAQQTILRWQEAHSPAMTAVLIDQPTIVKNESGQRPVENIVGSVVGVRHGGMQPACTGKAEMFGNAAPIWPFLARFGGAADPLVPSVGTRVIETYPVLMLISLGWILPDARPAGRLPKYNPARSTTFSLSDWSYVCERARDASLAAGLTEISKWLARAAALPAPRKADQDRVDAVLCLLAAIHLASQNECLMVGDQTTGYIVVPSGVGLRQELEARCLKTRRVPSDWVKVFRDSSFRPTVQ